MFKQSFELVVKERWAHIRRAIFVDDKGVRREYEMIRFDDDEQSKVIVVDMVPILFKSGATPQLVLVRQYRPASNKMTIEFPAGWIDSKETPRKSAAREIYEETGYTVKSELEEVSSTLITSTSSPLPLSQLCMCINSISPPIFYNPFVSSTLGEIHSFCIDGDSPENQNITTHNPNVVEEKEFAEFTEVVLLKLDEHVMENLQALTVQPFHVVDSRIIHFCSGWLVNHLFKKKK